MKWTADTLDIAFYNTGRYVVKVRVMWFMPMHNFRRSSNSELWLPSLALNFIMDKRKKCKWKTKNSKWLMSYKKVAALCNLQKIQLFICKTIEHTMLKFHFCSKSRFLQIPTLNSCIGKIQPTLICRKKSP